MKLDNFFYLEVLQNICTERVKFSAEIPNCNTSPSYSIVFALYTSIMILFSPFPILEGFGSEVSRKTTIQDIQSMELML